MLTFSLSRTRFVYLALFSLLLAVAVPGAQAQRLPKTVVPSHYTLRIDPNIAEQKFFGDETIDVDVKQATNEVVLNSLDLDVSVAEAVAAQKRQTAVVSYDKPNEAFKLTFPNPISAGRATLHLKYSGKLAAGLRGLYLSKSARRQYAVTQFEGTYARMMFPGFDEPGFKATFDLSVVAEKGDTAISNGRILDDKSLPDSTRHEIRFSTTPKMSTYLLALAVGDWQCLERTVDGVPIRVCAEPEKKQRGAFALEAAAQSIHFYNQWYGIKYPFGKLDMLAIPDYEWGGMENTAAIFYRDSALLLDEATASVSSKRANAGVVAHEIAHQWFGDLVTAAWWDDIWLNEGFASWMQHKPVMVWHPEWHLEDDEAENAQQVIGQDSLSSARAIHGDPRTSAEIKEMFDGITYAKGAAVLNMLEAYVGPEVFRKGVNAYLQAHANGNATSADFWQAMARVSGKPVDQIMPTFVMQPGVPLLTVSGQCKIDATYLQLEQERFYLSPRGGKGNFPQQWQIPVCAKSALFSTDCLLITTRKQQAILNSCSVQTVNRDAKGYYRVFYEDPKMLMAMATSAEKELTGPERVALVEDAWAMVRAGRLPVGTFLSVARELRAERNGLVIDLLAGHLDTIARSLVPEQKKQEFRAFVRDQFAPLAKETGWVSGAGDSDELKSLRASLLEIMGAAGDPDAIAAAKKITQDYMNDPRSVEGTIVGPALAVTAANGDATALYKHFEEAMGRARTQEEYYHYFSALITFPQPELVRRTLALVDEGKLRQQDYVRLFPALLAESPGREIAWDYLKAHWDALAEKVTTFGGRGAVSALGGFCSASMRDEVKQFFSTHRAPGAERALQQSLERMNNCIEFKQLQGANFEKWLQQGQ
jgi:aminopeptidase N